MRKFTLLIASLFITIGAMAQTATTYADGVYKIFWQHDQRGYLTYHADYPNDPQLAGVVNHNPNGHYQLTDEGIQLSWYLYTSATTSKSYLFEATTGKFITIDMNTTSGNGKRCALSEEVSEFAQFDLKATTNTTAYMLSYEGYNFCSGCGTNKGAGPVRFATDGQTDGGIPFVFVADGASITDEVKNAAIAKIEAFEADNTEAVAALDAAIEQAEALSAYIGTGVGKYTYTGEGSYEEKFAAIVAFREGIISTNDPTPEAVEAKTAELQAVIASFSLNMPEKGKYYRFKDWDTDNYMLSDEYSSTRLAMGTNEVSSIFYYGEDGSLLSYANGCYLPKAVAGGDWTCLAVGTTGPAATFGEGTSVGTYGFYVGDAENRAYYSGRNTYVDAGGTIAANNGYDWILEEVTELPVTVTAAGYATLYAPVALTVPTTGVTAHTVTINGEWAILSEALTTIPENTGVVLVGEGSHSFAITTADAFEGENALEGTVAATYVTDDAYVLGVVDEKVGFYTATKNQAENTAWLNNANKAYLPTVAGAANVASYSFRFGEGTTGIDQITDNREQSTAIFDLTGRRVEAISAPGIYIINGKKVLVK